MRRQTAYTIIAVAALLIVSACSTKYNTWYSRHYQMLTSEFNVLFNGNEAYKNGINTIRQQYKNDYGHILPVYEFSDAQTANAASADMETALKKAHKLIQLHSISTKPKSKQGETEKEKRFRAQEEFNPLVDDAYLLIGKANIVMHEELEAIDVLDFIGRKFPTDRTAYEGKIWKAIAYTQLKQYISALTALESYDLDGLAPADLYGQYMAAYANVLIEQKQYDKAIHYISEAAKNADCKHNRRRYKYILAQLYRQVGENDKAAPIFLELSKSMGDYDMTFAAKLDLATVATTPEELAAAEKKLQKMARDDKNIEQLDQIYYAIGKMDENKGNEAQALTDYKKSIELSVANDNQKGLSFLAQANIYIKQPTYIEAGQAFDSAAVFLNKNNERQKEAANNAKRYNPLVKELIVIRDQDSLMRIAQLPPAERDKFIQDILDEAERQERAKREAAEAAEEEGMSQSDFYNVTRNSTGTSGTLWYFYNTTMVNAGKSTFISKWGRRPNEDNWRRSNKNSNIFNADEEEQPENGLGNAEAEGGRASEDVAATNQTAQRPTRELLMSNLPLTQQQQNDANARIDKSLFASGVILYDDIKDYQSAIAQLQRLLSRNPKYDCADCYNALVLLYLAQSKLDAKADAAQTAQNIKQYYPDSQFAQYLNQPNYLEAQSIAKAELEARYEHTYSSYLSANYAEAISTASTMLSQNADTVYTPKYLLVRSLSYAKMANTADFRTDLTTIVTNYPNGEEAKLASKLLAMLNEGKTPVRAEQYNSPLNENGQYADATNVQEKTFAYNADTTHTVVCIIDNGLQTEAQFTVADYNFSNYLLEDLDIQTLTLADERQVLIVSGFSNKTEAMNYFYAVRDKSWWHDLTSATLPEIYVVSDNNLRLVLLSSIGEEYEKFFSKFYLNKIAE